MKNYLLNYCMIFWLITVVLTLLSLLVIIPGFKKRSHEILVSIFLVVAIYVFYLNYGGGTELKEYYSEQQIASRTMQEKMRPLFAEMKKQQTRLRLTLLEKPDDLWSKALLLEILGVEALYHEEKALANQYWDAALSLLASLEKDKNGSHPEKDKKDSQKNKVIKKDIKIEQIKTRILGLKKHVVEN